MSQTALIRAIQNVALPEHAVRAVIADYDELLEKISAEKSAMWKRRCEDPGFLDRRFFEAQTSMIGATLILTLSDEVDFEAVAKEALGLQPDEDLRAMRKELLSRALSPRKSEEAALAVSWKKAQERMQMLCQQPS